MIEFRHHPDRTVAILVKEHEDTWQPISFSDLYIRAFDMGSGFVEVQIKHEDDIDWPDDEEYDEETDLTLDTYAGEGEGQ